MSLIEELHVLIQQIQARRCSSSIWAGKKSFPQFFPGHRVYVSSYIERTGVKITARPLLSSPQGQPVENLVW